MKKTFWVLAVVALFSVVSYAMYTLQRDVESRQKWNNLEQTVRNADSILHQLERTPPKTVYTVKLPFQGHELFRTRDAVQFGADICLSYRVVVPGIVGAAFLGEDVTSLDDFNNVIVRDLAWKVMLFAAVRLNATELIHNQDYIFQEIQDNLAVKDAVIYRVGVEITNLKIINLIRDPEL